MDGFLAVIEISALPQFRKLQEPVLEEMINNCSRNINNTLPAKQDILGSFIVFTIESAIKNAGPVIETMEKILDLVYGYKEDIHEFSMILLYRKNIELEKIIAELKLTYFSLCEDFSLLIEPEIVFESGRQLNEENEKGYKIINLESDNEEKHIPPDTSRYIIKSETEKIRRIIIQDIDDDYIPEKVILKSKSEYLLAMNTLSAVENYCVCVNFLDNEADVINAFTRSVEPGLFEKVSEFLRGVEREVWETHKNRLKKINSDYSFEYLFTAYSLYLKGVMGYYKKEMRPQVIIYNGYNPENSEMTEIITKLSAYLEIDCNLISIFLDYKNEDSFLDADETFFMYSVYKDCCRKIQAPECPANLNYVNKRILSALSLTEGLLEKDVLTQFLIELGYNNDEITNGLSRLEKNGCIISTGKRFLRVARNEEINKSANDTIENLKIIKTLASFVEVNLYSGLISDFGLASMILRQSSNEPDIMRVIFKCLSRMLDYGKMQFVRDFLEDENLKKEDDFVSALKIRAGLLSKNKDQCQKIAADSIDVQNSPASFSETALIFELSRYYHSAKDYGQALNHVKKVLIFLQSGDYPAFEGTAFIELGFIMLCKGKLLESSEYLSLAVEKLSSGDDSYNLMRALFFSAVYQYIWGALDLAEDYIERAFGIAEDNGYQEWVLYITFFKCRLYFELGRYFETEKILSECLLKNEVLKNEERRKLFLAWTARACVYQGKIYRGLNMLLSLDEDPEVLFFLSEAYYFNGDAEKALTSIEKADGDEDYFKLGFMPLEYISWRNGFISAEGRILRSEKGTGVLLHNIRTMHAYLLGLTGNRDYGIEIMFSLTRDERISENDPFNRFYFYIYTQLLERRPNTDMIDKLTLMSKALKYLQQTSSRISDPAVRRQFMSKNYWNSKLVNEARAEKLI